MPDYSKNYDLPGYSSKKLTPGEKASDKKLETSEKASSSKKNNPKKKGY